MTQEITIVFEVDETVDQLDLVEHLQAVIFQEYAVKDPARTPHGYIQDIKLDIIMPNPPVPTAN